MLEMLCYFICLSMYLHLFTRVILIYKYIIVNVFDILILPHTFIFSILYILFGSPCNIYQSYSFTGVDGITGNMSYQQGVVK